jgi:hypothetical protein
MQKTLQIMQKLGFFQPKLALQDEDAAFERRMQKIDRVRQTAVASGMSFKNRPSQSKA